MPGTHAAPPTLVTSWVRLRPLVPDDGPALRAILATPAVSRWWHPPDDGFPFDHEARTVRWAVELLGSAGLGPAGAVVGMVQAYEGEDPDYDESGIDVFLAPSMHRRGLGRDVVTTVRDWLVDIRGHHLVTIDPAASNTAAIACYTACGFRPVGILHGRERDTDRQGWHDTLLMQYCSWWFDAGA
jgi:aminoglycoside 6'-N-acetyltransferase